MSKIKILSENLANQIAAGEVVERPASVVKEFVENSIDAGASRIVVEIEGGGNKLIRVIDDGEGMDQDDILLSLERHATSKLRTSDELSHILTLGFRGEAIPSIASVSRLTITSRIFGAELGNCAEVRFGQLRKVHEMGCAIGTVMEVRDLFGNVPARKKFLKTIRTELSHIDEIIINCALAMPRVGLIYTVDSKEIWSFAPGVESLSARLKHIMGVQPNSELITVGQKNENFSISGYLVSPEDTSAAAARLRIFVNRRAVRDKMIAHAATEGMHNFLMKGRRPVGVIFLDINPEMVDVNVHPAKQEIRFRQPQDVHQQVVFTVRQAMHEYQKKIRHAVFGHPVATEFPPPYSNKETSIARGNWQVQEPPPLMKEKSPPCPLIRRTPPESNISVGEDSLEAVFDQENSFSEKQKVTPLFCELPSQVVKQPFRYVGQFMQSYLLCETENAIAVIDQHAAHERLLFEQLKKQYLSRDLPRQPLLFPEMIECTPEQIEVLKKHENEIARMGVSIQEFGGSNYVIKAVPAVLVHLGPQEIIKGIFDHFLNRDGKGKGEAHRIDDILAVMACKAAVKAHDVLRPEEGEELLKRMEDADIFSHCPHGRPVVKIFSAADIKKWFFR